MRHQDAESGPGGGGAGGVSATARGKLHQMVMADPEPGVPGRYRQGPSRWRVKGRSACGGIKTVFALLFRAEAEQTALINEQHELCDYILISFCFSDLGFRHFRQAGRVRTKWLPVRFRAIKARTV